jgi:pyrimidine operon attenuation protein/uracil phosphoribosyltransferase
MTILLVDDVIFTGRTTKAALETLTTFGRPRAIRLFVLIDRGNREIPIQPDYCGYRMDTRIDDKVKLRLKPVDGVDDSVTLSTP